MSSLPGRLERLEQRVRACEPLPGEPSYKDQLRAKLSEQAERMGPIPPDRRPGPEEVEEILAKLNARVEALTGSTGGG